MVFRYPQIRARTMPEEITLAPASGAGIGKALADRLLARPGFIEAMVETAWGCLHAYSMRYDALAKETIETPDFKVRSTMFFGLLAHMEGEPVKRIIHQHLGAGGALDLVGSLRESPATLAALKREIEKAEWKGGRKAPKAVQATDTDAPSELPAE